MSLVRLIVRCARFGQIAQTGGVLLDVRQFRSRALVRANPAVSFGIAVLDWRLEALAPMKFQVECVNAFVFHGRSLSFCARLI